MGCCRKEKKKSTNKDNLTKKTKTNKVKEKKNLINDKEKKKVTIKSIDENNLQQQSIKSSIDKNIKQDISNLKHQLKLPSISSSNNDIDDDFINNISSTDNIYSIKTLNDLQTFVEQNKKPISMVFFYARYCPYSKRTISGLRQWAQTNKDRIVLYEADVEQALKLAEYYHIRTIPTVLAFNENNLLVPIWQRTATNVLSTDLQLPINQFQSIDNNENLSNDNNQFKEIFREKLDNLNNVFFIFDPSLKESNCMFKIFETLNENKQEQYLIILDNKQSMENKSKLILAITNEKDQTKFLKAIDQANSDHNSKSKSITSSAQSPYIWNRSIQTIENDSQQSSKQLTTEEINEYNGRIISKSSINTAFVNDQSKKNEMCNESINDNIKINQLTSDEYHQHIHLPNSNEIFYEKQYDNINDFNYSSSFDRFSTLTYQHVKDTNYFLNNQQEEICVLYLGPNRCRGFEDNLYNETNSSKLSLLTLKSHSLVE